MQEKNTHVPAASDTNGSAIAQHLLMNDDCAERYCLDWFKVVSKARSFAHLRMLEATYIQLTDPILCRQKEFVKILSLFQVQTRAETNRLLPLGKSTNQR